jgi:hypothetical protein
MSICGRTLRPSTLAERRVLLSFGVPSIRVPRGTNPFIVARRLGRLAKGQTDDHAFMRDLARGMHFPQPPLPSPDLDHPEPVELEDARACAG